MGGMGRKVGGVEDGGAQGRKTEDKESRRINGKRPTRLFVLDRFLFVCRANETLTILHLLAPDKRI